MSSEQLAEMYITFAKDCLNESKHYRSMGKTGLASVCLRNATFWRQKASNKLNNQ